MLKLFLSLLFFNSLFFEARSENFSEYANCQWKSEVSPEASIRLKKPIQGLASSLSRADLIFKDKVIRSIVYGTTLGYGINYWYLEGGISREGGRVNIDKRGGGRLVVFVSDKNIPVRSFSNYGESYKIKHKKVLLVGLGSLLYRSQVMVDFGKDGLTQAVEGYWNVDECFLSMR